MFICVITILNFIIMALEIRSDDGSKQSSSLDRLKFILPKRRLVHPTL